MLFQVLPLLHAKDYFTLCHNQSNKCKLLSPCGTPRGVKFTLLSTTIKVEIVLFKTNVTINDYVFESEFSIIFYFSLLFTE